MRQRKLLKKKLRLQIFLNYLVRVEGIGPSTSVLSGQRSTTELHSRLGTIAK